MLNTIIFLITIIGVYGKIFAGFQFHEFLISKKLAQKNRMKIYVVHTLFLTDSGKFDSSKNFAVSSAVGGVRAWLR